MLRTFAVRRQETGPGLPNNGANYTYLTNSPLVNTIEFKQDTTVQGRIARSYEQNRDLLTAVQNKRGLLLTTVSKYTYANDELGRREWVIREGSAFSSSHHDRWSYNDRNELTGSLRCAGTDPNQPCGAHDGAGRWYAYDPIGKAVLGDQVLVNAFGRETLLQLGQDDRPVRLALALAGRSRSLIRARRPGRGVCCDRRAGRRSIRRCRFL